MSIPPVKISHLNSWFGPKQVLEDINLTVLTNEIFVIMGGSGSGKTTLLHHILGLNRPASGTIELFGELMNVPISAQKLRALRLRIGVAFQSGALLSSLTVGENIALPIREHLNLPKDQIREIVQEKLASVQLDNCEDLMPAQLSGGMVKRVALARAIATNPDLLICDEPSAGLDAATAITIDNLLLTLRASHKMTLIVVTHDLASVFKIADRICILHHGHILAIDSRDVIKNSTNPMIQDLLHRHSSTNKDHMTSIPH